MHKDQKQIVKELLPFLTTRTTDDTAAAVLDCTLLNRALVQGPDPLFLMETCPDGFSLLCRRLELDLASGRNAIRKAHEQGPGTLLLPGSVGLPNYFIDTRMQVPEPWKEEALWLILVRLSNCTEPGYGPETTIAERLIRVMRSAMGLNETLERYEDSKITPFEDAVETYQEMIANTTFTLDDAGRPHTNVDHGFYLAYKAGHKVCAVHADGLTFWGTTPDTSLAEQGITVGKLLSPSFGIVFP